MPRSVSEWIGASDDQRAPKRVRDRLRGAHPNCYICTKAFAAGDRVALDHVVALINGGENKESNLRPVHVGCHAKKTAEDVAEKARIARKRQAHRGIRPVAKMQSRPTPISERTARNRARERMPMPPPRRMFVPVNQDAGE
jgi:5-methylcytosine-specific restriction protein A